MAETVQARAGGERTREKILAVAEGLFAAAGFDGVSVREVGTKAGVPFALVTYHFQNKLGLYKAVFQRRGEAIFSERMARLQAIVLGPDAYANFSAIAKALVEPLMRTRGMEGGPEFGRLLAREIHDPIEGGRGIVQEYFDPIAQVVIDLLQRAAPDVPFSRVCWAYHFAVGALAINHADTGRIERLSKGQCRATNVDELIEELTVFITAGFVGALRADR